MTYAMTLDNSWELMSEDEMYDVNGGIQIGSNYVYFSYNDIVIAVGTAAGSLSSFQLALLFIANTAWLNKIVGVGTAIWGLIGISAVLLGGYLLQAVNQQKGLEIKYNKGDSPWLFGIKLPYLSFTVR